MAENLTHDENTLAKVYKALLDNGIFGEKAVGIVSAIQNEGILFRERRRGRPPGSKNAAKAEGTADTKAQVEALEKGTSPDAWTPQDDKS